MFEGEGYREQRNLGGELEGSLTGDSALTYGARPHPRRRLAVGPSGVNPTGVGE